MEEVDKLSPNDSRVTHHNTKVNGHNYHYIIAEPAGPPRGTIFLVHGFPDMYFGWRYQVPFLTAAPHSMRVVVPDMMGYNLTDAPHSPSPYSTKCLCDDLAALATHLDIPKIILGGHDWGGMIVWRCAQYHPNLVTAAFVVCTPLLPITKTYIPYDALVKQYPNFKYQLQFSSGDIEAFVGTDKTKLRGFFNGCFGGRTPEGQALNTAESGIDFSLINKVGSTPLASPAEVEVYVEAAARNGLRGPTNYYRVRQPNFEEELAAFGGENPVVEQKSMFVVATHDAALTESMSLGMEKYFGAGGLRRGRVNTGHWALVEAPREINKYFGDFLDEITGRK